MARNISTEVSISALAKDVGGAGSAVDDAANNLLEFAAKIDTAKTKATTALTVITGNGFAHTRPDGVNVIPLSVLTA